MGVIWTKDQQKVIDLRNRNILVSAAAGSGKTAVLVERIMNIICDENHPVDVDRLLVVTFTKAAAAEMKERVGAAIRKRLEEQPNNGYLQRQELLVHHAQITTIDSFCSYILRNHFGEIDLDPSFRVGDEGELKLLKKDILKEILEEEYGKKRPEFLHFVECYAHGKTDDVLEELILKLYEFSISAPFPEEWLEQLVETEELSYEKGMLEHVRKILESLLQENEKAIELCRGIGGPVFYEEALQQDRILLKGCIACKTYEELSVAIRGKNHQALSRKKMPADVEEEKKDAVKNSRNHIKKCLEGLQKQFFYMPAELILQAENASAPLKRELVGLTLEFSRRFAEKKKKRNIVDFSDMEHLALKILVEKKADVWVPTALAKAYGEYFAEIMIDEYQDSNLVQELILTSISKRPLGGNNLFMVGDVKQSIYRFRQARPELFMEKQESYTEEESSSQKVNLSKNFRSREEVLNCVNFLFERMMTKELGNISYDSKAALYLGASMPEPEKKEDVWPELLLMDLPEEEEDEKINKVEMEASMVAEHILEMVKHAKVTDKKSGELRPAVFGDIVILLRTMSGWSDTFSQVLASYGIPSITGSTTGYFSSTEICTILNFLRVLDNQKQDIPFSAVLHSVIGNASSAEMAEIRGAYPEIAFHEACLLYAKEGRDHALKNKLSQFLEMITELRRKAEYLPIHKLLWEIYDRTCYEQLVRLQPNGAVRAANLQMLVQKALDFESTSYRGLFNFVRYIENLQKYEVDYGMAECTAGNENAVRIMSIHKSKGLEFPIVFISGLAKKFNKQDAREKIVMHPEYGLGIDSIDPKRRLKLPTLHKKIIQKQIELESLGEELRVLYVALTRAKEKLVMTGALKNACREVEESAMENRMCSRGRYESLCGAGSFLDWIIRMTAGEETPFSWNYCTVETLVEKKVAQTLMEKYDYELLRSKKEAVSEDLQLKFEYHYPYEKEAAIPGKVTVSELKRAELEEDAKELFEQPEIIPYIPAFLREGRSMSGAAKGTAYHRVMECMNPEGICHSEIVKERLLQLVQEGKITSAEAECINAYEVYLFYQSNLGKRMLAAKKEGRFYCEQPFVIAMPACEMYEGESSQQQVLMQGVIDAYFEEDDAYVILDYKTDYIKTKEELIRRYEKQLLLYKKALEQTSGKKVKECWIYSFSLGEEILVSPCVPDCFSVV